MKKIIFSLFLLMFFGCKKSTTPSSTNCTDVIVTESAPSCKGLGVIINGTKYPADDLPAQYVIDGNHICIEYSFWYDPAMCVCCGGTKVHVIAVH